MRNARSLTAFAVVPEHLGRLGHRETVEPDQLEGGAIGLGHARQLLVQSAREPAARHDLRGRRAGRRALARVVAVFVRPRRGLRPFLRNVSMRSRRAIAKAQGATAAPGAKCRRAAVHLEKRLLHEILGRPRVARSPHRE